MISSDIAVSVDSLDKVYKVYARKSDVLKEALTRRPLHSEFRALSDICVTIRKGEIVGVVGRNGAGKSTLLKLITGVIEPTRGRIAVQGSVSAILELGTGFSPEYSGRENVIMGGLTLGHSRKSIEQKLDSIIEFAELEDVIEQPFKTYSTGMQARLTFSTAISIEPDVLIVDEALAVGDARFQAKCFNWMSTLRTQGSTVLLVSHDTNAITTFCDRALLIEGGQILADGNPKDVVVRYQELLFGPKDSTGVQSAASQDSESIDATEVAQFKNRYGSSPNLIQSVRLMDHKGNDTETLQGGQPFELAFSFLSSVGLGGLSLGFAIKDRRGSVLWGMTTSSLSGRAFYPDEDSVVTCRCAGLMTLAPGTYTVTLGVAEFESGDKVDFLEDVLVFEVVGFTGCFTTSTVNLFTDLTTETSGNNQ